MLLLLLQLHAFLLSSRVCARLRRLSWLLLLLFALLLHVACGL